MFGVLNMTVKVIIEMHIFHSGSVMIFMKLKISKTYFKLSTIKL